MDGLDGKVAIVTGGASGIGKSTVSMLIKNGVKVVIADVSDDAAQSFATEIGESTLAVHLDVASEDSWKDTIQKTVEKFGGLHILVNNAGIGSLGSVEDETLESWNKLISINQTGVWLGMKHAGPAMKESGKGSIINMSSILGLVGGFGSSISYVSAKGAVRLMTKNAALHWAKEGIRVNSIHPGFIETPLLNDKGKTSAMTDHTPMGRLGTSEEVANAVAFLASDLSSYMTGSELVIDGGWTAD